MSTNIPGNNKSNEQLHLPRSMHLTPEQQALHENTTPEQLRQIAKQSLELAQLVAQNPNVKPDLLRELAESNDEATRCKVANNPNTPTDILWKLGEEFPDEVLTNSIFPLLMLENPNLLADIPENTLVSLLKVDLVPDSFLRWVANNAKYDKLLIEVTRNAKTSKLILEELVNYIDFLGIDRASSIDVDIREAVKLHVNWSGEIDTGWEEASFALMQSYYFAPHEKDITVWEIGLIPKPFILKLDNLILDSFLDWKTPKDILEISTKYFNIIGDCYRRLIELAANPNICISQLEQIVGHCDIGVREAAIYNPNIPLSLLQKFYQQDAMVKNPNTRSEILRELVESQWVYIRNHVAYHPNTPDDVLQKLTGESDEKIRIAVALNQNASTTVLKLLLDNSQHPTFSLIREAVVCNPNMTHSLLELLLVQEHNNDFLLKAIAYHPNVTVSILERLSDCKSSGVRKALAINSKTPASLLIQLAEDKDITIRMAVAGNRNTPAEVIAKLKASDKRIFSKTSLKHQRKQIIEALDITNRSNQILNNIGLSCIGKQDNPEKWMQFAKHPDSSVREEAFINLYQYIILNPDISSDFIEKAAELTKLALETAIARHKNTPISILERWTKHNKACIRLLVAKHPKTPINLLEKLLEDDDKYVRDATFVIYQNLSQNKNKNFIQQLETVKKPITPANILVKFASSQWLLIREAVAINLNTPTDILIQLINDKSEDVKIAVAQNSNTPEDILEQLANQNLWDTKLHQAAVKNLIQKGSKLASQFLNSYADSSGLSLSRLFVMMHPLAPSSLLAKNFRSLYWLERYAIAQNPSTPHYLIKRLTQDANRIVRAAAKANLETFYHVK